ncbi:MAG: hypothetical protein J6X55_11750 [Victivallales bacterium]|nr:hypothetical protein [Victivallales bacterium]
MEMRRLIGQYGEMNTRIAQCVLLLLLFGMNCLCNAEWDYSHWKIAKSYADINAAKKEARDNNRPLLIAFSQMKGDDASREYWRTVACDGKNGHDKYCELGTTETDHPICQFAEKNKIVLLYVEMSVFSALKNKIQGKEYKKYLPRPPFNESPIYYMVHVKTNADCETEDANVLNVGNDPGDRVDFIFGYLGQDGESVYDSMGQASELIVAMTGDQGFERFKSNIETIFSKKASEYGDFETYGLVIKTSEGGEEPEPDENDGTCISKAMASVEIGKWTTDYFSAKSEAKKAYKPLVVAYVKNITLAEAKALDAYVQTSVFKNAFSENYLAVINARNSDIKPISRSELIYLRSNGTIVGRLSNDPKSPSDGTVATVANFKGDNANKFLQFATLAADKDEEANNAQGKAIQIEGKASNILIGGVDAVDWFKFTTVDASETCVFTLNSNNSMPVNIEVIKEDGGAVEDTTNGDMKDGIQVCYKSSGANETAYLKVASNGISQPRPYSITVKRTVKNYAVSFDGETKRSMFSSESLLEIPVTLTERNRQAGEVSVKVKLAEYDEDLIGVGLRATPIGALKATQTLTWTDAEKTSSTTKVVYLLLPYLTDDDATWEGHKDIGLELQDVSSNAVVGASGKMTIELISEVDSVVFVDGDTANVTMQRGGVPVSFLIAAPETSAVYWEKISGEIPNGLEVSVEKTDNVYELILTPGDVTEGKYEFTIRLYSMEDGIHRKNGGTMKITCTVNGIADGNPFGKSGTRFAGTVLEPTSEIDFAKDVTGIIDVMVGENVIEAEVKTRLGEIMLATPTWTSIDQGENGILTAIMDGEDTDNVYHLTFMVGMDGTIDGSVLTVNDKKTGNENSYDIIGQALPEVFSTALNGFEKYYTVDFAPFNPETWEALTEGDHRGFGGMRFSINENGIVEYHGFLPNGQRFGGKTTIRNGMVVPYYNYLEFTVFSEMAIDNEPTGQWFGCLMRIYDHSENIEGIKEICIDCTESMPEPVSYPVWYRADNAKLYMRSCGSAFDRYKSLATQLSKRNENRCYLVVEQPQLDNEGVTVVTPRLLELEENDEGTFICSGDSLFNVGLTYSVEQQGQSTGDETLIVRDGEFSGTITLYSRGFEDDKRTVEKVTAKKHTVEVHGILVAATEYCCSIDIHPAGAGYYLFNGISYPVRIYWRDSVVEWDGSLREDCFAPPAEKLSPSMANGVAWPEGAEDGQVISGLSDGGAEVTFSTIADILAVGDNNTPDDFTDDMVKIIKGEDSLSLAPGNWTLCPIDLNGGKSEGEPMTLKVSDTVAMELELTCGWNLIGFPKVFDVDSLTWDSVPAFDALCDNLKSKPHHTLDSRAMVMTDSLEPGKAYWVYATEPQSFKLAGKNPQSGLINPTIGGWWKKTEKGKLEFCTEPTEHYGGWYWQNNRFVYKPAFWPASQSAQNK